MISLASIREKLSNFEQKELFRICLIYFGLCICGVIGILGYHFYEQQELQGKIVQLNSARRKAQDILTQFQSVKQQKQKVDQALQQNKPFNIQKFFQDLAQQHNLSSNSTVQFKRQKLPNGYFEESLHITINQITTEQLCQILSAIEQKTIVYTISVDISKVSAAKKINAVLAIATLQPEE